MEVDKDYSPKSQAEKRRRFSNWPTLDSISVFCNNDDYSRNHPYSWIDYLPVRKSYRKRRRFCILLTIILLIVLTIVSIALYPHIIDAINA
ncbi:hypothetical protein [Williamwhitmania taraxaci]|uniref:Uncharacterized protein n=1 Tax=Williamwhitmania taraxaci TaxID=1640674 RepID=A0A1G6UFU5_9BACT|nr:hypothetical protein [Williamwhitmania taraxaci]SDD39435.1 hypothetical protein SAMN05216323_11691 [Williamwhitmania taraxaci]